MRIIFTMIAAIVLYVPVSYLINTNFYVQKSELNKKYGILYDANPSGYQELSDSLEEYRHLADLVSEGSSMVYVQMHGAAFMQTKILSDDLKNVLFKAGWQGGTIWRSDSTICFLEDAYFEKYLHSCILKKTVSDSMADSVILVNRCKNRARWKENVDNLFPETSLLNTDLWYELYGDNADSGVEIDSEMEAQSGIEIDSKMKFNSEMEFNSKMRDESEIEAESEMRDNSGIQVYYGIYEESMNADQCICPNVISDALPEGIDFNGDITLILPFSQMDSICSSMKDFWCVNVCGVFEDYDEMLFETLCQNIAPNGIGQLRYTRKVFQEWYDSMRSIHMAMKLICTILFFIALLNIFCTIVFQHRERKSGLAVLWTLGQTEKDLLQILVLENIRTLIIGMAAGVSISCMICYYIYDIFQYVWNLDFVLPARQIALIAAFTIMASAAAIYINWFLMKRQNFLQDIKDAAN